MGESFVVMARMLSPAGFETTDARQIQSPLRFEFAVHTVFLSLVICMGCNDVFEAAAAATLALLEAFAILVRGIKLRLITNVRLSSESQSSCPTS